MKHTNTGVEDREQWRARIMRALTELRGEDALMDSRFRRDEHRDDASADSAKL
jgi:hypothetical protein